MLTISMAVSITISIAPFITPESLQIVLQIIQVFLLLLRHLKRKPLN